MKQRFTTLFAGGLLALTFLGVAAAGPLEDGDAGYQRVWTIAEWAALILVFLGVWAVERRMNKHDRIRKEAGPVKMKAMEPAYEERARTGKEKMQDAACGQERQEEGREKQYAERILTYADDHNPAARKTFDESEKFRATFGIDNPAFVAWARGDYPTALRLWRFQAQKGDAAAQIGLGDMCREGLGVLQDYAEAATWYRKAAEQGEDKAQLRLGRMCANGQGVPQDNVLAHMWFSLAASRASDAALRDLAVKNCAEIAAKMPPAQIAEAQRMAREWAPK